MLISDAKTSERAGVARVSATVRWEDIEGADFPLFFEVAAEEADGFWADPCALAGLTAIPAWYWGERRIAIDADVCPMLAQSLVLVMRLFRRWYPVLGPPPRVEALGGSRTRYPSPGGGAVLLMSCGIDSLAALRWNRLHIPHDHPSAIRTVLSLTQYEEPSPSQHEFWLRNGARRPAVAPVAEDAGVRPVAMGTNAWWLVDDGHVYDAVWQAGYLAGAAGMLSRDHDRVVISSSHTSWRPFPYGHHPMVDSHYSSTHVHVSSWGTGMTRFERATLVAGWDVGRHHIRVCQNHTDGSRNCGSCEKCLRTQLALIALRKLDATRAFEADDVTPESLDLLLDYEMLDSEFKLAWYERLREPLLSVGRDDLATAIDDVIARARRAPFFTEGTTAVGSIVPPSGKPGTAG